MIRVTCHSADESVIYSKDKDWETLTVDGAVRAEGIDVTVSTSDLNVSYFYNSDSCEEVDGGAALIYDEQANFTATFTYKVGAGVLTVPMICEKFARSSSMGSVEICNDKLEF